MARGFILAVDVEATCDDQGRIPRGEMEIIEIGAVLLDAKLDQVGEFQTFIRPFKNPVLTPFCIELTSISQDEINNAPTVHEAFRALGAWLQTFQPFSWCSWGDYDQKQFKQDSVRTGAPWPFPGPHFNAKQLYADKTLGRKLGLAEAIEDQGLEWVGTHHRGIDDARNVARILQRVLSKNG
ncbi:3'-5' exonuclease [Ahrensia marina]|uniref:exonuclease domain-containing protein n=1 Tax=Ahrensia marina TaxID=1514904 RepID=UPI0035CFF999